MDYLGSLVPIVLGQHHILSRIFHIFKSTEFSDYYELSMSLYSLLVPMLEERIGPANFLTTIVYADHIDCVFHGDRSTEALALATRYRAKVNSTGQNHSWLTEFAITQTAVLCAEKESEGLIGEAIECVQQLKQYPLSGEQEAVVEIQMGNYNYKLANYRGAISAYRQATRLAMTAGCDERLLLTCLTNLETALNKANWIYEANRVQQYRLSRVVDFATETTALARQQPFIIQNGYSQGGMPAIPELSSQFDPSFVNQDASWLWQDNASPEVPGSSAALPEDLPYSSMRWLGMPVAPDPWTASVSVSPVPVPSSHYPSLSPLLPGTVESVGWHPDVFP
jgi:hypothetical protein